MIPEIKELFKPQAKSIRQIFGDADSYYQVPDYQRPYRWGTEEVEALWDDIYTAMEDKKDTYFLGAVILTRSGSDRFEVVDGQQRLTTLTILLCVMRDLYFKNEKLIQDSIKSLVNDKYRLHLVTQSKYQNKFEKEVLEGIKFPNQKLTLEEREQDPFLNAASIFREKLKSAKPIDNIRRFFDYLMDRVVIITIACGDQASAVRLFQVLNIRGLDLDTSDLIKSYLYSICDPDKLQPLKSSWNQFEDVAEDVDERTEDLVGYYGLSVLERNPKLALYDELIRHKDFRNRDANSIVYDMLNFCKGYKELVNTDSKLIYTFWYLPAGVYWRSILATARFVQYADLESLEKVLRRLYYTYWVAGYTVAKIKQLSFNIISWVKAKKSVAFIEKEIKSKMSEDRVVQYVKETLDDADIYGKKWLKPLLLLVEYNRTDDCKLAYIEVWDRKLQIEHILPTGWDKNEDWKKQWNQDQATQWLDKLGNLTLLSGNKNIVAANDSFAKKRTAYKKAQGGMTAFEITKEVAAEDTWTEVEVKKRHARIKQEIFEILEI